MYLHGRWREGDGDVRVAVVGNLRARRLHFEDVQHLGNALRRHRLQREDHIAGHLVGVGDLEPGPGLAAHDDVVEDEPPLLLPVDAPGLDLVEVLPHAEVLADVVLLEDRTHVLGVDGRDAGLGDQLVRDPAAVVRGFAVRYLHRDVLWCAQTMNVFNYTL